MSGRPAPSLPTCSIARFEAAAPNRKWIADFTYVWTAEGWLYVAAVIDLFSRRVVGWSMSAAMTAQLVTDALVMAIWRRGKPDALLHHSDRGSQYTSEQFQRLMADQRRRLLDEPIGQRLGQRGDGELLLVAQDRADSAQNVSNKGRGQEPMCSTTSSASTIPSADTRRLVIMSPMEFERQAGLA